MYGCEAWTISKQVQKKLEAIKMYYLQRTQRVSCTAKNELSNETVLREADTPRSLINRIDNRKKIYFGHVMRKEKLNIL